MGGSNEDWGSLDPEAGEAWDHFEFLPEPGVSPTLDAFVESKNISIASLVKLGARLAEPGVLAFVFPGGIKFRDVVSGRRWNWFGSEWTGPKFVRATPPEQAEAVIIAEGETDGARLTDLYPRCDIAVIPGGARYFPAHWKEQFSGYEQILVGLDSDRAGEEGFALIRTVLPAVQRFPSPQGKDWASYEGESVPLPGLPGPQEEAALAFDWHDLGRDLAEGLVPPVALIEDVFYDSGYIHWIDGQPGHGKTVLTCRMTTDLMRRGKHVIWMDYEMGEYQLALMFQDCGAEPAMLSAQLHYVYQPKDVSIERMNIVLAAFPECVVVIDSASKQLRQFGYDEDNNTEITKWTQDFVVPLAKPGGAMVLVLDHIAKGSKGSSYSRGGGAKLADCDVAWRVEKEEAFNRNTVGKMILWQNKDRPGVMPSATRWEVGNGDSALTFKRIEFDDEKEKKGDPGDPKF